MQMRRKNSQEDLTFEYEGIKLPLLEMTDPYYPHSKLAKSIFSGYYILFFMYSVIFMITYPTLNFLEGEDLLGITIIKLMETNIAWDLISAILFVFMSMAFIQVSPLLTKFPRRLMLTLVFLSFLSSGVYIIRAYKMYFTDRIFIIVLNWALCAKTLSYLRHRKL